MLTPRYLPTTRNFPAIMNKIVEGTAPPKFTVDHLKGLGFGSSNDRAVIPLLKDLGFLSADGTPTPRYHEYRDRSRSKYVMAEALREAYDEIFHINASPSEKDRDVIQGKFKSKHNSSDRVAECQAMTFFAVLKLADLGSGHVEKRSVVSPNSVPQETSIAASPESIVATSQNSKLSLRYNIEIHLPATKDIEVYNAIFKSLKEHLVS